MFIILNLNRNIKKDFFNNNNKNLKRNYLIIIQYLKNKFLDY